MKVAIKYFIRLQTFLQETNAYMSYSLNIAEICTLQSGVPCYHDFSQNCYFPFVIPRILVVNLSNTRSILIQDVLTW